MNRMVAPERGFTLVELLISASLMGMILTAAYVCFSASLAGRKTIEARADLFQSGRVALTLIGNDLRSACPLSRDFAFLGMDRVLGPVEADNLDFATRHLSPAREGGPIADWCEVSYYLNKDPKSGVWVLYRRRDPTPDDDPLSGGSREEIARGVQGMRFEYYDGWDWYDEWGDLEGRRRAEGSLREPLNLEGMPDAVRVTLWLDAAESPAKSPTGRGPAKAVLPVSFQTVVCLSLARSPVWEALESGEAGSEGESGAEILGEVPSTGGRP